MQTQLAARIEEAMARLEGKDPASDKRVVLIVDDEKGPRESLRMILSPQHRVVIARDASEALEALAREPIDLVTVDLNMPGMQGDELMRIIRRQHPQVEVVIITGCGSLRTAVDGIRCGVFDYLTKPFDVVEVSTTARRALERSDSRKRLVAFLQGIATVLGHDQPPDEALQHLAEDPVLRERLTEALQSTEPSSGEEIGRPARMFALLERLAEMVEGLEGIHRIGHARRVAFLSSLIAERLALPHEECEAVRVVALLHDIGRIPARLAASGSGRDNHSVLGAELTSTLRLGSEIEAGIAHHHEHWDGTGGPHGLAEEEIPLAARIVAVADAFDTLTSDQPGRPMRSLRGAIMDLRKAAGNRFDPHLVEELISITESGLTGSGPIPDLCFEPGEDPIDSIAAATAWIEGCR